MKRENLNVIREQVASLARDMFSPGSRLGREVDGAYEYPPEAVSELAGLFRISTSGPTRHSFVLMLALLGAFSCLFPGLWGQYGGRRYYLNLMIGIIGPASSGKGIVSEASRVLRPIDKRRLAAAGPVPQEYGEGVPKVGLSIPADSSAAAFVTALALAPLGGACIETELEASTAGRGTEWANKSVPLRKCAEHEEVTSRRVGKAVSVATPKLSVVFAGTFGSFLTFMPSPEDGLFSRFIWYILKPINEWLSAQPTQEQVRAGESLRELAAQADTLALVTEESVVCEALLTPAQWSRHTEVFSGLKADATVNDYNPSVFALIHRTGVIVFRLAILLSAVRQFLWDPGAMASVTTIDLADEELELAVLLGLGSLDHALRLREVLPTGEVLPTRSSNRALALLEELGDRFDRWTAVEVGKNLFGIATRTVDKYLASLVASGHLERRRKQYYKSGKEGLTRIERRL